MQGKQLNLWEDKKQIILEREKVDMSTLKTLKTRRNAFHELPKDTYFIYKTGGVNPFMKELGPIFPVIKNSRGKILKQSRLATGKDAPYPYVIINRHGVGYKCYIHKIVGLAFLKNNDWEHKFTIDHLDNGVFNYLPENLEWVTVSENNRRAYERGRGG